jgi:hypothetical protein
VVADKKNVPRILHIIDRLWVAAQRLVVSRDFDNGCLIAEEICPIRVASKSKQPRQTAVDIKCTHMY